MNNLEFLKNESLDVIWAEGSIYIMGFENGLSKWKPLVKYNGFIIVSELSWIKDNIPDTIKLYWEKNYPAMKSIQENKQIVSKLGYDLINCITVPPTGWWDYYNPIQDRINELKVKYNDNSEAKQFLAQKEEEISMYRLYGSYYGYVFYIMQKK